MSDKEKSVKRSELLITEIRSKEKKKDSLKSDESDVTTSNDQINGIVFLPRDEIDDETYKQIQTMAEKPGMEHVRVMPDCHKGNGCCVGFTSKLTGKIVPNYIGGDIGCGMTVYPLSGLIANKKLAKVEQTIRREVPMGKNIHSFIDHEEQKIISDDDFKFLFDEAQMCANNIGLVAKYDKEYFENVCKKINYSFKNSLSCLGTLGGGNHFIEINRAVIYNSDGDGDGDGVGILDENDDYVTIHSGSRGFGRAICIYHQKKIDNFQKVPFKIFDKKSKPLLKGVRDRERRQEIENALWKELEAEYCHPKYLEGEELSEYLVDMVFAQVFAQLNRRIMIRKITNSLQIECDFSKIIESKHNYINFEDGIWRKGAISAQKDELCVIALNCRDGVLICKGKGNKAWNSSGPHGAGRILTRAKGKKLSLQQFKKDMSGVYSTSVIEANLDESPQAYKDSKMIKKYMEPTVEIVKHLKPIVNVKSFG